MADKYLNLAGAGEIVARLKQYADSKEGLGVATEGEVLVIDSEVTPGEDEGGGGGGSYVLPTASASTLGGVKIGSGITITDGVISAITSATVQSMIDTALAQYGNGDTASYGGSSA